MSIVFPPPSNESEHLKGGGKQYFIVGCVFFMPNEDMFSMHLRQGLMKYDYIFRKGRLCTTNTCHIIWLQARHMQRLSDKHAIVAGCVKKFGTMLIVLCTNISVHQ